MVAPSLTNEQRRQALEKAKAVRAKRAGFLEELSSGNLSFSEGIERASSEEALKRTLVKHVIRTQPGYGVARTDSLMREIGISQNKRVGGLGKRQKTELLKHFE